MSHNSSSAERHDSLIRRDETENNISKTEIGLATALVIVCLAAITVIIYQWKKL